jgi:hypothetical protein
MKSLSREEVSEFFDFPKLHEHQRIFATTRARCPLGIGGYGSGKSLGLVIRTLFLCTDTPYFGALSGNVGVLGRFSRTDLENTTMMDFFELIDERWIQSLKNFKLTLINGSVLHFVPLEERRRFKSMNLGFAGFEQVEEVPEDVWDELSLGRLRRTRTLTNNPVLFHSAFAIANACGNWVYDKWGKNEEKLNSKYEGEKKKFDPNYLTIHSSVYDNRANLPAGYIENMERQYGGKGSKKARHYMLGEWGTMEGSTFEWNQDLVLDKDWWPPTDYPTYIGVDYGERKPTAFVFIVVYPDPNNPGRNLLHVYDEVYMEATSIGEVVKAVDEALQYHAVVRGRSAGLLWNTTDRQKIQSYYCDPAMRRHIPRTSETEPLKTIIDVFLERSIERGFEIILTPGNNTLDLGIDLLNWLLTNKLITYNPRCVNVIEDTKNCVNDKNGKPKDGQKDHGADASRYAAVEISNLYKFPDTPKEQTFIEKVREKMNRNKVNNGRFIEMGLNI